MKSVKKEKYNGDWGQLVGDQPVNLSKDDSHEYVTGTFLLAASEMYKMNLKE